MSGLETIASRYAQALLELGSEAGTLDALVAQTQALAQVYTDSEELRAVIDNPLIAEPQREAVLTEVSARLGLGDPVRNTARLLAERRRMILLPLIARALMRMSDERLGIVRGLVGSAEPLSEDYARRLGQELERMTGRKVVLDRHVDPSLIGGVVTRLGDLVIDGSVRSRLEQMRDRLLTT